MTSRSFRIYLGALFVFLVLSLLEVTASIGFSLAIVFAVLVAPLQVVLGDALPSVFGILAGFFACFLFYRALRKSNDEDIGGARARAAGGCTVIVLMIIIGLYYATLSSITAGG